ncbi:MAG: ATP-dependent DNA helicase RecG [Defluviitaleaceae bacterium]|nr:ATP-dependent DNA helicase RecG [Defluviitaleaceae bacterium]
MSLNEISVATVKGIGPTLLEKLQASHIHTVADLLESYPNRYDSYDIIDLNLAKHEEKITIAGQIVVPATNSFYGRQQSKTQFSIAIGDAIIKVIIFNRAFLKNKLVMEAPVTVTGKWDLSRKLMTATTLKLGIHDDDGIVPAYRLSHDLTSKTFQKMLHTAYTHYHRQINDDLPQHLIERYRLISAADAIKFAHFPENNEQVKQAARRIKYEELLKFQLKLHVLKKKIKYTKTGFSKEADDEKIQHFMNQLPFELTTEQHRVLKEITTDLKDAARMNRLLQGDVGSGKTVVAAIALLFTITAGYQGAIMAPTEILAKQHLTALTNMFACLPDYRLAFLSSNIKGKKRRDLLAELAAGQIHLLVGTHSLIQEEVIFSQLGLAVIDEQHRFGVDQRKKLRQKGEAIDILMMSATPIPRTLAISAFGDMDVSSIKELPLGRKPIQTFVIGDTKLADAQKFIKEQILDKGQQVYIITPLIDESEVLEDLRHATLVYELWKDAFKNIATVGLMHGKLEKSEKDEIMHDFAENNIQILISTTVIEVGVNVPNANLILIYDANRFGLSQLHQLRGRVGRGTEHAYCILLSNATNAEAKERLGVIAASNDGFEIAEADLKLRGPGDFFGSKQSGLPTFKMANLIEDYKILDVARQDAYEIMASDEFQHNPDFLPLRDYVTRTIANENHQFD